VAVCKNMERIRIKSAIEELESWTKEWLICFQIWVNGRLL
jgi:hypothetical protein